MRRSSQLKLMHIYCVYLHSSSGRYLSTQFNLIVIFKRRDGYRTIRYGRNGKPNHCVPSIVYYAKRRPTLIADFVAVSHAFQGYHFFLVILCFLVVFSFGFLVLLNRFVLCELLLASTYSSYRLAWFFCYSHTQGCWELSRPASASAFFIRLWPCLRLTPKFRILMRFRWKCTLGAQRVWEKWQLADSQTDVVST